MTRRALRLAALVAVNAVLIVLLGGCGHAGFSSGARPDVTKVAQAAGATVTASGQAKNRYLGGTGATWYAVSRPDTSKGVLVDILTFDSAAARDSAYTQVQFGANRLPSTVVYTWGNAVVQIAQVNDRGLLQNLARAMEAAGAK